jgi:uncharacterized protein involved in exopolysaccharide biosynthesis
MSENRELTMDDYLAMLRRRLKVILIPALLSPLAGFMVSYVFPPTYKSQATVLVEPQKMPANYVQSVITSDFIQRIQTLQQKVLSPSRLRPVIQSLNLVKPDEEGKLIEDIQQNMRVEPMIVSMSAAANTAGASGAKQKKSSASQEPAPGFNVTYTDSNALRAQKICSSMTSLILDENLRTRAEVAQGTTEFLGRQLEEAKRAIDEQDSKLANFKKQYMGQLPGDADNNMRILMSLNSQLDATTQTLGRAQQDKAYTESMLAQQTAAWKSSQSSSNPQTLEQQLTQLQGQLLQLQARYTDDHPDVIKTKADIAEIEKKLKQINAAAASTATDSNEKASATEPPEIRQLRLQIHQYQGVIEQDTLDQKRLQSQIGIYQSRTAMSPNIEEHYKVLTRDNDNAQAFYKDLLAHKYSADLGSSMETQQQGEQMQILVAAGLPDFPSFPIRPLFAAGGLGAGLALGLLIAIWLEFSDKSIRTEKDAAAIMDLPLLISVPWLGEDGEEAAANGNGRRRFWGRGDPASSKEHENVEV